MDDNEIIALFFARDENAIRLTQETYGRRLFHLANNIVKSREDAEESVSDTYWKVWDSIPPQKPLHFFAYIARICRNFALKKLDWANAQKRSAEIVALTDEMACCIPDNARQAQTDARELGRILDAFLRTLPPRNRNVFLRRYWFADSISEIAQQFSISESAVQMRLNRSKEKLAIYLAKEGIAV